MGKYTKNGRPLRRPPTHPAIPINESPFSAIFENHNLLQNMTEMQESLLMRDSSTGNGPSEAVLDFVLSWTLRRACIQYATEAPKLYEYCRKILFNLLEIDYDQTVKVLSVETWKQWNKIDLHANITLEDANGDRQHHALLIETKVYTGIHDDQLIRYKRIFEETYRDGDYQHRHYVLLTCRESSPSDAQRCQEAGYRFLPILDLCRNDQEDTESDLFNEFWLRIW